MVFYGGSALDRLGPIYHPNESAKNQMFAVSGYTGSEILSSYFSAESNTLEQL
jgi:hypothetical protein